MSDGEDGPFEKLDPADDREGDPFENFDTDEGDPFESIDADEAAAGDQAVDDDTDDWGPASTDAESHPETPDPEPPESDAGLDEQAGDGSPVEADPFAEMSDRGTDPFADGESVFERVDVETIDADQLWEEVVDADASDDSAPTGSRYADVSKHRYCEQCEHFSRPPDAHCTNEETEIVEFLDMDTVRLIDCPVVAEQRTIADEE